MKRHQIITELKSVALMPIYPFYVNSERIYPVIVKKKDGESLHDFRPRITGNFDKIDRKYPNKYWIKYNYENKRITHFID